MKSPDRLPSHSLQMAADPTPPACLPLCPLLPFLTPDLGFYSPNSPQNLPLHEKLILASSVSDPLSAAFRFRRPLQSP